MWKRTVSENISVIVESFEEHVCNGTGQKQQSLKNNKKLNREKEKGRALHLPQARISTCDLGLRGL